MSSTKYASQINNYLNLKKNLLPYALKLKLSEKIISLNSRFLKTNVNENFKYLQFFEKI